MSATKMAPRQKPRFSEAIKFQFTPLREGRPLVIQQSVGGRDFNSRPYVRGDQSADDGNHPG